MKVNTNAREVHLAHLYNPDAIAALPMAVRTAERLGFDVDIQICKDGMGKVHSLQVFATPPEKKET